ncbi:alpha/beta hydrolase [Sphingobacterium bovistauri]|uniref:Alpha/beta hydrolase n=1 Tax=Sphingobacterium bovistauri TaxID=2781959 RepID=A0ABS7Z1F7_9SPHI|nr:alpha/beta hydrolase [Sphingobacterium bovistauri]MCA5004005.1 alpha/beta hydrolase [Sphingobacterium bovistauri]
MHQYLLLISLWGFVYFPTIANGQIIPRDSSFTVKGTYEKERKKFPDIQVAEVATDNVKIYENIAYKKLQQRKLYVDIFEPKADKNNIAIILIHGGGWRSGDKTHMHQLSLALAEKGFTCFTVEYRLSLEAPYPAAVEDIQDAIIWIKNNSFQYQIDANKVFCLGTSSGGQLAALVGTLNKSITNNKLLNTKIAGVIDIDGLLSFTHPDAQEGTMAAQWLDGDRITAANNWKVASPLYNITAQSAPILFITSSYKRFSAGKNDVTDQYRKWNIPCDELNFENSPHTFWYFHPWFTPTVNKIDSFISELVQSRN